MDCCEFLPEQCGDEDVRCGNDQCVKKAKICDGNFDCSDGTDESDCGKGKPLSAFTVHCPRQLGLPKAPGGHPCFSFLSLQSKGSCPDSVTRSVRVGGSLKAETSWSEIYSDPAVIT